ncbi:MAG: cation:proton antiporter [Chloroflexota bacterium]
MEIPLLRDVVIILVLAMGVVYLSHRMKLPVIVGLLVTGVLAGPHALGTALSLCSQAPADQSPFSGRLHLP